MLRYILAITFIVIPLSSGKAQSMCGVREDIVAKLQFNFQERRKAIAIGADGAVIELFVSPTGSWSVVARAPTSSTACMVASGESWTDDPAWEEVQDDGILKNRLGEDMQLLYLYPRSVQ